MFDKEVIDEFVEKFKKYRREPLFAEVHPSEEIVENLLKIKR